MRPQYLVVMQSSCCATTELDLAFNDDLHALVAARRLFVQELVSTKERPLSLHVGRRSSDGQVDWLNGWTSPRQGDLTGLSRAVAQARQVARTGRSRALRRGAARLRRTPDR